MRCPLCRIPAFRRFRARLARIFALGLLAASLPGCDQATAPDDRASAEPAVASTAPATLANNRIAFMAYTNEESDLYTITPSGGGLTRLTSFAGSEWDPSWSWDHKRLAFVRWRLDANKDEHGDIFLMNADGSNKRWARSAPTYYLSEPSWSPDGKRLVVTFQFTTGSTMYLTTLDLGTGTLAWVAPSGVVAVQGHGASWDATGTSIVYIDAATKVVHRFVPGGKDEILLTTTGGLGEAVLSPDGTRLAYNQNLNGNSDIFVLNLATKANKRLTFYSGEDNSPTWSPDGNRLAFLSHRSGKFQVWSMSAATGGNLVQVTKVVGAEQPVWRH